MLQDELIRISIHQVDQFMSFGDDGFSLAPGQHSHPEPHDFNILFLTKQMWDLNGIVFNKTLVIEKLEFGFQ